MVCGPWNPGILIWGVTFFQIYLFFFFFLNCVWARGECERADLGFFLGLSLSSYKKAQKNSSLPLVTDRAPWQVGGSRGVRGGGGTWKGMRILLGAVGRKLGPRPDKRSGLYTSQTKQKGEGASSQPGWYATPWRGEKRRNKQTCFAGSRVEFFELCSGKGCFRESLCSCVTQECDH